MKTMMTMSIVGILFLVAAQVTTESSKTRNIKMGSNILRLAGK